MPLINVIVILCAALFSAGLALLWLRQPRRKHALQPQEPAQTLLFEDGILHHASAEACARFALVTGSDEWEDLRDQLLETFPDFPSRPTSPSQGEARLRADAPGMTSEISITWRGAMAHVSFFDDTQDRSTVSAETLQELDTLRQVNASVPHPVWQVDARGKTVWRNPAYVGLYTRVKPAAAHVDEPLFETLDFDDIPEEGRRASLQISGTKKLDWFNVTKTAVADGAIFNASSLNAVVLAEEAQRNFVQTLAKTFAHLSIGLAIFDRNRQLALFNPALIDLTNLPAEFLSARPTMMSFFDRLRENRRMPEPKNYRNWRQEIAEVIAAANDGRYQETWSLESGQTYKVSGRPHPDGATAFLLEDISAEVSLTRNFRAELETAQCLLDTMVDGLAVFSATGQLTFSNCIYQDLWGLDTESSFVDFTISDSIAVWREMSNPNKRWQEIEDFVLSYGHRQSFDIPIQPKGGAPMACQIVPIVSGATLVRFCKVSALEPLPEPVNFLKE